MSQSQRRRKDGDRLQLEIAGTKTAIRSMDLARSCEFAWNCRRIASENRISAECTASAASTVQERQSRLHILVLRTSRGLRRRSRPWWEKLYTAVACVCVKAQLIHTDSPACYLCLSKCSTVRTPLHVSGSTVSGCSAQTIAVCSCMAAPASCT